MRSPELLPLVSDEPLRDVRLLRVVDVSVLVLRVVSVVLEPAIDPLLPVFELAVPEVLLGLDEAEPDVLLGLDAALPEVLGLVVLAAPDVVPRLFGVLPLGAVCVLVLGPGVSFADWGRVFLPVSPTAPEPLGEVLVCA